jgi:hypothetical protein
VSLLCHQVNESKCEELGQVTEEVGLKLALWKGRGEMADLTASWRLAKFEDLDVASMEDTLNRSGSIPVLCLDAVWAVPEDAMHMPKYQKMPCTCTAGC